MNSRRREHSEARGLFGHSDGVCILEQAEGAAATVEDWQPGVVMRQSTS